jgi:hypothetical protein
VMATPLPTNTKYEQLHQRNQKHQISTATKQQL